MTVNKNQWVSPRADGKWQVKGEKNSRPTKITTTQKEAISVAKQIAKNQHSELFVQRKDGTIRERNSYGTDPFPPKG